MEIQIPIYVHPMPLNATVLKGAIASIVNGGKQLGKQSSPLLAVSVFLYHGTAFLLYPMISLKELG